MKELITLIKQIAWMGLGMILISVNPPQLINGVTVLGWIISAYTLWRIYVVQIRTL